MSPKRPKPPADESALTEVLLEIQRVGNVLRVTAIDPKTATEVIMVADPRQSQETIKRLAARKLDYVLKKKREQAKGNTGNGSGRFDQQV